MRLFFLATTLLLSTTAIAQASDCLPISDIHDQKQAIELVQEVFGEQIEEAGRPDASSASR